jgi:hypothetical protein
MVYVSRECRHVRLIETHGLVKFNTTRHTGIGETICLISLCITVRGSRTHGPAAEQYAKSLYSVLNIRDHIVTVNSGNYRDECVTLHVKERMNLSIHLASCAFTLGIVPDTFRHSLPREPLHPFLGSY